MSTLALSPTIATVRRRHRRLSIWPQVRSTSRANREAAGRRLIVDVAVRGCVVLLRPSGALDVHTIDDVRSSVGILERPGRDIVIDLNHVTTIDAAGLHTLRTLVNRAQASKQRLLLLCDRDDLQAALSSGGMASRSTSRLGRSTLGWRARRRVERPHIAAAGHPPAARNGRQIQ